MAVEPQAQAGHFYAVGVGPGAPDLVTLRAANLVRSATVILAPRSSASSTSLALDAVRPLLSPGQVLLEQTYPMQRDLAETQACWGRAADQVLEHVSAGRSVVHITIGDPLVYSTTFYLIEALSKHLDRARIHVVPGISAFQAVAARFGEAVTIQEDRLMLMTATDMALVEQALSACETLVLYKAGRRLAELRRLLERHNLLDQTRVVFYVEQAGKERVLSDLRELPDKAVGYMATVIVHIGRRPWAAGE